MTPDPLRRLREGNARFVETGRGGGAPLSPAARTALAAGQQPFAIILGCADSRVPPEIVFDQPPGALFVVRVAGNVATTEAIGSIEYAVEHLGAQLVVVLGHSRCGAVTATVEVARGASLGLTPAVTAIAARVRPAVEQVLAEHPDTDADTLVARAVRANIRSAARALCQESDLIDKRAQRGDLLVVEAEYALDTGVVEFLSETSG